MDSTKRFFHITLLLYFATMCMDIISCILYFKSASSFHKDNVYYLLCIFFEACLIVGISIGCLVCGIRLQWYVKKVQLCSEMELKFLFRLNVTLLIVLTTYVTRCLYIVSLVHSVPDSYSDEFAASYFAFTLCTRWLPYIFCSFCLIHEMRYSGAEIAARSAQSTLKSAPSADDDRVLSESESDLDRESYQLSRNPHLLISNMLGMPHNPDDSTLSRALLSDEHSPSSRFLDDSFRMLSSDSLAGGQIDHFGPPSFTESALHRSLSLQREEDMNLL